MLNQMKNIYAFPAGMGRICHIKQIIKKERIVSKYFFMCMIKDKGRIWCVLMSSYCVRFAATGLPGKSPPDFTCPCPLRGMGGEQCKAERGGWILGETANVRPSEAQRQFIIRVSTASPNFANLFFNKILVGPFQSFFQGYFRGPLEVFHCLFVGKGGAVDVPFSGRAVG